MSEKPVHPRPRRLVDWINPAGAKKVHSLIDKVYTRKNLEMAWERVKANRGSGGVDGQTLEVFAEQLDKNLDRLQSELKEGLYQPQPVRQVQIPKVGKPGEFRGLGIPTVRCRFIQQAVMQVLQRQWDPTFSDHSYGFRPGRSAHQAVVQAQRYIAEGYSWVVDLDLEKFLETSSYCPQVHERLSNR